MKVLVWHNKHDNQMYDASTPELELAGFMEIFKEADETSFYTDLEEPLNETKCDACLKGYHKGCESSLECPCTDNECKKKLPHFAHLKWMREWYAAAKAGNAEAAKELIQFRSSQGYEYEKVSYQDVKKAKTA